MGRVSISDFVSYLKEKHLYLSEFHRSTAFFWALLHFAFYFGCKSFGLQEDFLIRFMGSFLLSLNFFVIPKGKAPKLWQSVYIEFVLAFNIPFLFSYTAALNDLNVYWVASLVFGAVLYAHGAYPVVAAIGFPTISFIVFKIEGIDLFAMDQRFVLATLIMSSVLVLAILFVRYTHHTLILQNRDLAYETELATQRLRESQAMAEIDRGYLKTLRKHQEVLQSYVSPTVRVELSEGKDPRETPLKVVDWAILYTDLIGYTKISRLLSPLNLATLVDSFFDGIIEGTFADKNGEIDKLMGDAAMATFESPENALKAYLRIKDLMKIVNSNRIAAGTEPFRYGVGISFGAVAYGNFGNSSKMDRTVVGGAVNEAARLEKKCRLYGVESLVTEAFMTNLNLPQSDFRPIDFIAIAEGYPILIYEYFGADPEHVRKFKRSSQQYLERAVLYKKDDIPHGYEEELLRWIVDEAHKPECREDGFYMKCREKIQTMKRVV